MSSSTTCRPPTSLLLRKTRENHPEVLRQPWRTTPRYCANPGEPPRGTVPTLKNHPDVLCQPCTATLSYCANRGETPRGTVQTLKNHPDVLYFFIVLCRQPPKVFCRLSVCCYTTAPRVAFSCFLQQGEINATQCHSIVACCSACAACT